MKRSGHMQGDGIGRQRGLPTGRGRALSLLLVLLLASAFVPRADAQAPARHATLAGWQDELHVMLMDRRGAYGGLHYDRGALRPTPFPIDHEYAIDLLTYGFTPADDADWYARPTAFRLYAGSINTSRFATRTHLRAAVPAGERHRLDLDAVLRQDWTADRALARIGYSYGLSPRHRLGARQSFASYKPDLDFALFYEFTPRAPLTARGDLVLLDVANNLIFDQLRVEAVQEDTLRSYRNRPLLLAARVEAAPRRRLHMEAAAGWMPTATAEVRSSRQADRRFLWTERARYAGLRIERPAPHLTAGLLYHHTFTYARRHAPAGSRYTSDYAVAQRSHAGTAYLLARRRAWQGDLWLSLEHRTDRQRGADYDLASLPTDLDYTETRLYAHLALVRVPPERGLLAGLTLLHLGALDRDDYRTLRPAIRFYQNRLNRRLAFHLGYRLRPGASLRVGGAVDLDGDAFYPDAPRRYDGGFFRMSVTW